VLSTSRFQVFDLTTYNERRLPGSVISREGF
jgi:hypothetical protein